MSERGNVWRKKRRGKRQRTWSLKTKPENLSLAGSTGPRLLTRPLGVCRRGIV